MPFEGKNAKTCTIPRDAFYNAKFTDKEVVTQEVDQIMRGVDVRQRLQKRSSVLKINESQFLNTNEQVERDLCQPYQQANKSELNQENAVQEVHIEDTSLHLLWKHFADLSALSPSER